LYIVSREDLSPLTLTPLPPRGRGYDAQTDKMPVLRFSLIS